MTTFDSVRPVAGVAPAGSGGRRGGRRRREGDRGDGCASGDRADVIAEIDRELAERVAFDGGRRGSDRRRSGVVVGCRRSCAFILARIDTPGSIAWPATALTGRAAAG